MVECFLAKEDVAGSTPVSRSNKSLLCGTRHPAIEWFPRTEQAVWGPFPDIWLGSFSKGRGTQVVRERSAKPLCAGSIPARASNPFNNLDSISGRSKKPL